MIGKPLYKINNKVSFTVGTDVYEGTIEIVDEFGTFFNKEDVSYDILVPDFNGSPCLFKHISEKYVKKQP